MAVVGENRPGKLHRHTTNKNPRRNNSVCGQNKREGRGQWQTHNHIKEEGRCGRKVKMPGRYTKARQGVLKKVQNAKPW